MFRRSDVQTFDGRSQKTPNQSRHLNGRQKVPKITNNLKKFDHAQNEKKKKNSSGGKCGANFEGGARHGCGAAAAAARPRRSRGRGRAASRIPLKIGAACPSLEKKSNFFAFRVFSKFSKFFRSFRAFLNVSDVLTSAWEKYCEA